MPKLESSLTKAFLSDRPVVMFRVSKATRDRIAYIFKTLEAYGVEPSASEMFREILELGLPIFQRKVFEATVGGHAIKKAEIAESVRVKTKDEREL